MAKLDYPVHRTLDVASVNELVDALHQHAGQSIRLLGRGSSQNRLPAPPDPVVALRMAGLSGIERLEPDDLTCTVWAATPREELDAALAEHGLWLPCPGTGTVAGLLAADLEAASSPNGLSPRSLLLGFDGVLADGLRFKSGARVVKSVAGFDLQKLLVGSRGRLFAATRLHLKLRPQPRGSRPFRRRGLDPGTAITLYDALRLAPAAPLEVHLERRAGECEIHGILAGHPEEVRACVAAHALTDRSDALSMHSPADHRELVQGWTQPSRLGALLECLPPDAWICCGGTGQFHTELAPAESDALLAACAELGVHAEIQMGTPQRRGLAATTDPAVQQLEHRLKQALDPGGILR